MDETQKWYLMKHNDESVFGPIPFEQLKQWAVEAQVSPLDKVSNDGRSWIKAPMVPELEMDFLIEVSADQYYGPTTTGAVREFLKAGEIGGDTIITNCKDGTERAVKDSEELQLPPEEEEQPVRTSIRLNLQQRVRELEHALLEERRARELAEQHCEKLEARLSEFTSKSAF